MDIIYGCREVLLPWAQKKMPFNQFEFPDEAQTIGVANDTELLCVAVYHNYFPAFRSISMSIAATSTQWATKSVFGKLLAYPFLDLQCQRITTWQPDWHKRARKLVEGVGFKEEGRLRKGGGDCDVVILGLLREEAERWLCWADHPLYTPRKEELQDGQAKIDASTRSSGNRSSAECGQQGDGNCPGWVELGQPDNA